MGTNWSARWLGLGHSSNLANDAMQDLSSAAKPAKEVLDKMNTSALYNRITSMTDGDMDAFMGRASNAVGNAVGKVEQFAGASLLINGVAAMGSVASAMETAALRSFGGEQSAEPCAAAGADGAAARAETD
jgi:hypothetical protein